MKNIVPMASDPAITDGRGLDDLSDPSLQGSFLDTKSPNRLMKVNSYDEWSPLKEVIVGSPVHYDAQELELSFKLFFHDQAYSAFWYPYYEHNKATMDDANKRTPVRKFSKQYLEELNEDVEGLVTALKMAQVTVHRPTPLTEVMRFRTPYWEATTMPALNVRDQAMIVGDEIIETAPQVRARYFENDLLKPIFYHYFRGGSRWSSMPRPMMTDRSFDTSYVSGQNVPAIQAVYSQESSEFDTGFEIMFDSAQCLRFGKDILVNVSTENHELGLKWLERHFEGRFRFHRVYRLNDNHIDSTILPLRPGLLLLRNPSVREQIPESLQKWDVIYPPEPTENIFPHYDDDELVLTSTYIDLNVLSIDENTVVVNSLFPELIRTLERHGFTTIPVRHRHRRLFSGGFHCFTLDTVRAGGAEDYLS